MAADLRALLEVTASHELSVAFGPVPLTGRADHVQLLDHMRAHALGDARSAPWAPLDVLLHDGTSLPAADVPPLLRPTTDGPTYVCHDDGVIAVADSTMLWVVDAPRRRALRWTAALDDLPVWEAMRPLRFALRWAAADRGAALVHAAAVAGARGAALLVGGAGAGKSTTTFACVDRGLDVLGDDYCIVEPTSGSTVVHATYLLGTLDDRSLALLPHVRPRVVGEGLRGKSLVRLDPLPEPRRQLTAVALCSVVQAPGEATRLVPLSRAAALRALAPSTMFQIPGLQRETWEAMVGAIRHLPAFELRVGSLDEVAPVLLDRLGAREQA